MHKNKNGGFTLIEVLTVIMIIAILASVVLVSLDAARKRARDSAIQNQVRQISSLGEAHYTIERGYSEFKELTEDSDHPENSNYLRAVEKINEASDDDNFAGASDNLVIHFSEGDSPREYCAYSNLVRADEVFCVDSSGDARIEGSVVCDSENLSCAPSDGDNGDNGDNGGFGAAF